MRGSNFSGLDLFFVSAVEKKYSFTFHRATANESAGVPFPRDKDGVSASPSYTSLCVLELVNWCV